MKFVSRKEAGLRPPRRVSKAQMSAESTAHWNGPTITIAGSRTWDHSRCPSLIRGIQNFHMDGRGWSDLAYNFVECPHGYTFEGRGLNTINGANGTNPANRSSHAICSLAGQGNPFPNDEKIGFRDCVMFISRNTLAPSTCKGHRDHKPTECPGNERYNWVRQGMRIVGTQTPVAPQPTPSKPTPAQPVIPTKEEDMAKWSAIRIKERSDEKWLTNFIVAYPLGGRLKATVNEQKDHINILRMEGVLAPGRGLDKDGNTIVVEDRYFKAHRVT